MARAFERGSDDETSPRLDRFIRRCGSVKFDDTTRRTLSGDIVGGV